MTDHVLTIQRVLSDGAIAKTITCRSGRIAVLRGHAPEKLFDYEQALRGQFEDERAFRISFDGKVYNPQEHLFVGFENLRFQSEMTTSQLLAHFGLSEEQVKTSLLAHGLSQIADMPLSRLTNEEAHCVALLKASYEVHPLTVMNDPFIPIPESSREMFAQTIANGVWKNKTIVIVTSLSWRPDHWIDNDLITRVQVDQTQRRATVGIGAENPLTELAKQLRKEKKNLVEKQEKKELLERKKSSVVERFKGRLPQLTTPKLPGKSYRLAFLSTVFVATLWFIAGDVLLANLALLSEGGSSTSSSRRTAMASQDRASGKLLLDIYPVDIRDGVVSAFYGESQSESRKPVTRAPITAPPPQRSRPGTIKAEPQRSFRPPEPRSNPSTRAAARPPKIPVNQDRPPLPPEFEERMHRMMEGKDPAVQERIEMMMRRMHEQNPNFGGR